MSITLGANIASLRGQRQLRASSERLANIYTRLSSGQRINKASDDAAGLSIADNLNTKSRVYAQGLRNINDGISVLAIADGAVAELSTITLRLTELAEQSANGVLGTSQRASLNEEAQALKDEYLRIIQSTKFNGRRILTSEFGELRIQAGIGVNGSIQSGLGGSVGTGSFASPTSFPTGSNPQSISTGDFNGDGILDLVTADVGSDTASVLLGNGTGSFADRTSFQTGTIPRSLATGDFNGDGILDLVTADVGSNTASVLLGNGTGSFADRTSFPTGPNPQSISTGDFNGDGILDLVTADFDSNSASVLLGNGTGSFSTPTSFPTGSLPQSISTGDFNGDGILDLVTADFGSNTASVLLGNGTGSFADRTSFQTGSLPQSISTGDFNGDGILDLVTANSGANTTTLLLGQSASGTAPLLEFSVNTIADARQALTQFEQKRNQLARQRSAIGVFESRLATAAQLLQASTDSFASAESRVRNADIASETVKLTRESILQQAAASVLAQANQQPALALGLLV